MLHPGVHDSVRGYGFARHCLFRLLDFLKTACSKMPDPIPIIFDPGVHDSIRGYGFSDICHAQALSLSTGPSRSEAASHGI
jgi:hypothetical protein